MLQQRKDAKIEGKKRKKEREKWSCGDPQNRIIQLQIWEREREPPSHREGHSCNTCWEK